MISAISRLGALFINLVYDSIETIGMVGELGLDSLRRSHQVFRNLDLTIKQMIAMGVTSIPLVVITSLFTGAVSVWQAEYQFANIIPDRYLGTAVCKAIVIELGPVLTSLVVAGRVGTAIAAELGTMTVTEQIDAMASLALNPVRFLVLPRFLAGLIMLPILTIFSDFLAILGSWVVAVIFLGVPAHVYTNGLKLFFNTSDVIAGLIKSFVFGGIIALMGCYHGLRTSGGAEGVGQATMKSVVASAVLILIFDFIIAFLLF